MSLIFQSYPVYISDNFTIHCTARCLYSLLDASIWHTISNLNLLNLGLQSISRDMADNVSHPRRLDPTMELITYSFVLYLQHGRHDVKCKPSIPGNTWSAVCTQLQVQAFSHQVSFGEVIKRYSKYILKYGVYIKIWEYFQIDLPDTFRQ